jgi:hypothetical protein
MELNNNMYKRRRPRGLAGVSGLLLAILLAVAFGAGPVLSAAPAVTTNDATGIGATAARLNGHLTSMGGIAAVNVSFQWGLSSGNYTAETAAQMVSGTVVFYFDLNDLAPATTYYFCAKAVGEGTTYGVEKMFTTAAGQAGSSGNASRLPFQLYGVVTINGVVAPLGTPVTANINAPRQHLQTPRQ